MCPKRRIYLQCIQCFFCQFLMTIGQFQSNMLDPFASDRVTWPFWLFTYIFLIKNTNIFTDFEIWLIENVIKPTYQNEEKCLSMCFVTFDYWQHAENRNVCTLNDDGFICTVYSDFAFIWFYGRQDIINQIMETKRIFMAELWWQ